MTRQLAFDLPGVERRSRADFFPSPANAEGLALVERQSAWPGAMALLVGPEGSGKSHLAQIWADLSGAALIPAADLPGQDLAALAALPALGIEDADRIAGHAPGETALFHLFNMARAAGRPVLFTARTPPRDWGIALPDLASRMQSLALTRLQPPDDALLSAVLAKLFSDRQVAVAPSLIPWAVTRMERSIAAARLLVDQLDRRALARGGPITRADAALLLDRPDAE